MIHHPPEDEKDPTITLLSTDIRSTVDTARRAANGKDVLIIGANVARWCLEAELVNDIHIVVAPILLGMAFACSAARTRGQLISSSLAFPKQARSPTFNFASRESEVSNDKAVFAAAPSERG